MKKTKLRWIWGPLLVLVLAPAAWALVSVDELIRLHSAGLTDEALLLVVANSDTPDTLSTDQLTRLIDAGVPDTVITALVAKADVVMEDWEPVDVDEALDDREIYTETQVERVYPRWVVAVDWGYPTYNYVYGPNWYYDYWNCDPWYYDPWYYGWCGTWWYSRPVYYGHYRYYWPSYYVGIGIGWGPFHYAYGYYDPWYYDPYFGYYGYDGYYGHYYDHHDRYRYARSYDPPTYRHGVYRDVVRDTGGRTYRPGDDKTPVTHDRSIPTRLADDTPTIDRSIKGDTRTALRDISDGPVTPPTGRDTRTLDKRSDKTTLKKATREPGRYELKGDDVTFDVRSQNPKGLTRTDETKTAKQDVTRYSKQKLDDAKAKIDRTSTDRTRVTRIERRTETKAQQLERYKAMKPPTREVRSNTGRSTSTRQATSAREPRREEPARVDTRTRRSTPIPDVKKPATQNPKSTKRSKVEPAPKSRPAPAPKVDTRSSARRQPMSRPSVRSAPPRGHSGATSRGGSSGHSRPTTRGSGRDDR